MTGRRALYPGVLSPRKIAVVRALQLGDLLVAVPALRSLRAGFPDAEITFIGLPWAKSFVRRFSSHLDRFVELAAYPGLREVSDDEVRAGRFLNEQRAYRYDLVIQMHGSGRISTPLALALGGQVTAGYYDGDRPAGLSVGAPYPGGSEIQRNLDLARLLGCPDLGVELEFPLSGEDRAEATRHLGCLPRADRPWVGIHPGARAPARRWSPRRFAALADVMAREHRAQIILTGGAAEREIVAEVRRHMTAEALDLSGRTTIGGLAALIERLDLFVSNDSGPAHLAVAVGTASVVIFGPAEVARWAPLDATRHPVVRRDVPCSPCGYTDCPIDHRCLEWIDPSNVLAAARRLLSLPAASAGQGGAPSGPHAMTGTAEYAQGPKPARVRPRRCVPSRSTTIHLCHPESPPCDL